jgi:hypothetical protein
VALEIQQITLTDGTVFVEYTEDHRTEHTWGLTWLTLVVRTERFDAPVEFVRTGTSDVEEVDE